MDDAEIETQSWDIVRTYLEGATFQAWHRFAAGSNYDSNAKPLRWLIDNPAVDRATALVIYWSLGAPWYAQYASEHDLTDGSPQIETFRLLRLIEQRYADGFYANHGIWFDPRHWHGPGPDSYPDVPVARPIPAMMLLPADGDEYVDLESPDEYEDGLPFHIVEQLYGLYD
jgi:hypothetical protein